LPSSKALPLSFIGLSASKWYSCNRAIEIIHFHERLNITFWKLYLTIKKTVYCNTYLKFVSLILLQTKKILRNTECHFLTHST
jgi:hypothetical protein